MYWCFNVWDLEFGSDWRNRCRVERGVRNVLLALPSVSRLAWAATSESPEPSVQPQCSEAVAAHSSFDYVISLRNVWRCAKTRPYPEFGNKLWRTVDFVEAGKIIKNHPKTHHKNHHVFFRVAHRKTRLNSKNIKNSSPKNHQTIIIPNFALVGGLPVNCNCALVSRFSLGRHLSCPRAHFSCRDRCMRMIMRISFTAACTLTSIEVESLDTSLMKSVSV